MVKLQFVHVCVSAALVACNVSQASRTTGGISLGDAAVPAVGAGDGGADAAPSAECPRALAVVSSDYTSTNVSVASTAGRVLSESLLSSGSAPPGLTTALSGDVVLPLARPTSGRLVLIDRYPNSVLTWVDPKTAGVIGQLGVGTGFGANPHDYLEVSPEKAYVTRYETNPAPGKEPFDAGGDLLVIDTKRLVVTGRVALAAAPDGSYLPRADHLLLQGNEVWVILQRMNADFTSTGDTRLVGVDTTKDAVTWTVDLPGLAGCGGVARSPSGDVVALSCGALSDADPLARSGIVLLSTKTHPPTELRRFSVAARLGAPVGPALAFASDSLLVSVAYGDTTAKRNDVAFSLNIDSGDTAVLADAGAPFAFGDVVCTPGCDNLCFLADAQQSLLRVWHATASGLDEQAGLPVDPSVGLPPRVLGTL
jgi:hypothetical protein